MKFEREREREREGKRVQCAVCVKGRVRCECGVDFEI